MPGISSSDVKLSNMEIGPSGRNFGVSNKLRKHQQQKTTTGDNGIIYH